MPVGGSTRARHRIPQVQREAEREHMVLPDRRPLHKGRVLRQHFQLRLSHVRERNQIERYPTHVCVLSPLAFVVFFHFRTR